jgi:hypothetical protein
MLAGCFTGKHAGQITISPMLKLNYTSTITNLTVGNWVYVPLNRGTFAGFFMFGISSTVKLKFPNAKFGSFAS